MNNIMSQKDLQELLRAKEILENPSLAMKIADKVGYPIEYVIKKLPEDAQEIVTYAVDKALKATLELAVETLDPTAKHGSPSNFLHKVGTFFTGTIGGVIGFPALPFELPVTTTVMFRSICDIARSKGFNVIEPPVKLDCMQVFALGGYSKKDDAVESGYYATRIALAMAYRDAVEYLARREAIDESAPALVRFIMQVAARFEVEVTAETAAKLVPVVSGLLGGSINVLFTDHFQKMSEGHFTVRSLEEKYGEDVVREMWGRV